MQCDDNSVPCQALRDETACNLDGGRGYLVQTLWCNPESYSTGMAAHQRVGSKSNGFAGLTFLGLILSNTRIHECMCVQEEGCSEIERSGVAPVPSHLAFAPRHLHCAAPSSGQV